MEQRKEGRMDGKKEDEPLEGTQKESKKEGNNLFYFLTVWSC